MNATQQEQTRDIRHELAIDAPIERVWKAFTEAEELVRWFPQQAKVTPGPQGEVLWQWDNIEWKLEIDRWEPPYRLRLRDGYTAPDQDQTPAPRWLDIELESERGQTVLRLVHSGFQAAGDWEELYDGTNRGWFDELRSLKLYLEHHAGSERDYFMDHRAIEIPYTEAWERFFTAKGLFPNQDPASWKVGELVSLELDANTNVSLQLTGVFPGRGISAVVPEWNHALLRVLMEDCFGGPEAILCLGTYGLAGQHAALRSKLESKMAGLFPSQG